MKVSKIRCDNGKEYINNELMTFCRKRGIKVDSTIPYSPQLNGKSERLNRTLMEKARSLIFDSGMEKKFWGEAARVATYLLNRSPTSSLKKETPYEKWTNKKPNLGFLQFFGSDVHARVLGHLKKLDSRSQKYKMVGYASNGYRLWDEKRNKIIIRRDVVFREPKNDFKIKESSIKLDEEYSFRQENYIQDLNQDMEVQSFSESYQAEQDDIEMKEDPRQDEIIEIESNPENEIEYIYD